MSVYVKIKKNYGDFVLDAEFEAENEAMALLGASGCGKSLTLRSIAGIVRPDEGVIVADGVTLFDSSRGINLTPQKRRVGLLFQNYALFPNMTVEDNVTSVLKKRGGKMNVSARFKSLAEKFYFEGLENHYPAQLSGGQQQRVALARIIASDPSIIMLDEPLSALDSYLRWQLEGELAKIIGEFGGTILYVSHNRDEVYRLCRRVCVIDRGRFEPARAVAELFESPGTLASALLSGCKNYSRVIRLGANSVHASDWKVDLTCDKPVGSDVTHIGVRAHYICIEQNGEDRGPGGENSFLCRVLRVTDDVFSTIVSVRPVAADSEHDFSRIRVEFPKVDKKRDKNADSLKDGDLITIKIKPANIMPLSSQKSLSP
jgi:molybdate transport system ATP-binding protein